MLLIVVTIQFDPTKRPNIIVCYESVGINISCLYFLYFFAGVELH